MFIFLICAPPSFGVSIYHLYCGQICLFFLTLMFPFLLPFPGCDWLSFPFCFLEAVLTDLESSRLLQLSFSTTVMRYTICYCYGYIVFHFSNVNITSYLLSADVISCSGVIFPHHHSGIFCFGVPVVLYLRCHVLFFERVSR